MANNKEEKDSWGGRRPGAGAKPKPRWWHYRAWVETRVFAEGQLYRAVVSYEERIVWADERWYKTFGAALYRAVEHRDQIYRDMYESDPREARLLDQEIRHFRRTEAAMFQERQEAAHPERIDPSPVAQRYIDSLTGTLESGWE